MATYVPNGWDVTRIEREADHTTFVVEWDESLNGYVAWDMHFADMHIGGLHKTLEAATKAVGEELQARERASGCKVLPASCGPERTDDLGNPA